MRLAGLRAVRWLAILFGAGALLSAQAANAASITVGDLGSGTMFAAPAGLQAQSFSVPAGMTRITSAKIHVWGGRATTLSLKRGFGAGFAALTPIKTVPLRDEFSYALEVLDLPPGGVAVTPGEVLYLESSNGSYGMIVGYYPDGQNMNQPAYDALFSVTFDDVPVAAPVPTVSEWMMILMAGGLAGGAAVVLVRRERRRALAH